MDLLRRFSGVVFALFFVFLHAAACGFAPDLGDGAFACGAEGACPPGYACALDGRCRRPGTGPDAVLDAGADAAESGPASTPVVLVAEVSSLEGHQDSGQIVFTARLVPPSAREVRVGYATADGTAQAGTDYVATSGTIVFPPGSDSQTVPVMLIGDRTVEPNETFFLALDNATSATIDPALPGGRAKATILNDDSAGIFVDDVTVVEGNTGTKNADFVVVLTSAYNEPVTVNYATQNGTATAPLDFTSVSGTLTFAPGETRKVVSVPIIGDVVHEPDEQFILALSNAAGAPLLARQARAMIDDDDPVPALRVADASAKEGNSGTVTMTFHVTLTAPSAETVKVSFATSGGTATANDYSAASGTLTFEPGRTSQTIQVQIHSDVLDEDNETFVVTLSAPLGATIAKATALGTIEDDDAPPIVSIADVSLAEGNAGTKSFPFAVRLSGPSSKTVTVGYTTAGGTATAPGDFTAASGMVTFAPGETTKTVGVTVHGDAVDEAAETFTVALSMPTSATLGRSVATGTILNDDSQLPNVTIDDVAVAEGEGGMTTATFTVTLSASVSQEVTVGFATAPLTATEGVDFVAKVGKIVFPSFTDQLTQSITIEIVGDSTFEPDETFAVNLADVTGANILDAQGVGTITNDDAPPSISIASVTDAEGNVGAKNFGFDVTLSHPSSTEVTVSYATAAGTATAGADYQTRSGVLTFAPGEVTKTLDVPVVGDRVYETDETFTVTLNAPSANAVIANASATGTITNDEPPPSLAIDDVTAGEGDAGTTSFVFTVTMSRASEIPVTVAYATANGTAIAGIDYSTAAGTLTFAPGAPLTQSITVVVSGDVGSESNETFTVTLSSPTPDAVTLSKASGTGTILDDDSPLPSLSIGDATNREGRELTFTVTLSGPAAAGAVTVDWNLVHVTSAAEDLGAAAVTSGTLTFFVGETRREIVIPTFDDALDEIDERFEIRLSNPSPNAAVFDAIGTGTITDDDATPALSFAQPLSAVTEGHAGTTPLVFTVRLDAPSGRAVTVDFVTSDVSTTSSGSARDYDFASGTLVFAPGETEKTVTVQVRGDSLLENAETFQLHLLNPEGATLPATPHATGQIDDDD